MKKLTKMMNLTLALLMLLSTILPVFGSVSQVYAADAYIQYNGKITYGVSSVRRLLCKWCTSILY